MFARSAARIDDARMPSSLETFSDLRHEIREADLSVAANLKAMKTKVREACRAGLIDDREKIDLLSLMPTEKEMEVASAKADATLTTDPPASGAWWRMGIF